MVADELGAFARAIFRVLDAAFPFEHGPAFVVIAGELREDALEIHLPVADGAEAAGAFEPGRVARIDALTAGWIELRVLDVEHLDPLVIDVDVVEIVELLQTEMARVEQDVAAPVALHAVEEHLERRAVEQVFARVDFIAEIDAGFFIGVEDGEPALRELFERRFKKPRRALGPREEIGPGERAGEGHAGVEAEAAGGFRGEHELFHRPFLPRFRIAAHALRGEGVEQRIVGGVDGDELALQVGGEFGDLHAHVGEHAFHLVAVSVAFRRLAEIEQRGFAGRDLDADKALVLRPLRDGGQRVERRFRAHELGEEDAGAFHGLHVVSPQVSSVLRNL